LRDYSIDNYVRQVEQNLLFSRAPSIVAALRSQQTEESEVETAYPLPRGWALKDRKENKRFTEAQKQFMTEKFNAGITNSKKYDPRDVAKLMRKDPRFPEKEDWLTAGQIQGFWSRLAQTREKTIPENQAASQDDDTDPNSEDQIGDDDIAHRMFEENVDQTIESVRQHIFDDRLNAAAYEQHIDDAIEAVLARIRAENQQPNV
jgi:hypothetical protein